MLPSLLLDELIPVSLLRDERRAGRGLQPDRARCSPVNAASTDEADPLGSCTMKQGPKLHVKRAAVLPGHARLQPLQDLVRAQAGPRADVAPPGGRWPRPRGRRAPQPSAVGTARSRRASCSTRASTRNWRTRPEDPLSSTLAWTRILATVTMGGYDWSTWASTRTRGHRPGRRRQARHLRRGLHAQPNTLGLFNPNIEDICLIVHGGAMLYDDGANLNQIRCVRGLATWALTSSDFNLHL